jgi:transcriptional regulator with XRE-family HTH domain
MTIVEFKVLSLDELASITGLDKTRWSKYFNGQLMTEAVLNSLAKSLGMEPHVLLLAINQKRLHRNAINAKLNLIA